MVFNKQESFPVTTNSNSSTYYQNSYVQQSPNHNIGHYTNSNSNYDRSQSNDFNKRSASLKAKVPYTGEG